MSVSTKQESEDQAAQQWFYQINEVEEGPLSFRELRYLAMGGTVEQETLVWSDADSDKKPAREVRNLIPRQRELTEKKTGWDAEKERAPSPYQDPKRRTIMDGPPGGLYLPYLKPASFFALLGSLGLGGGLAYLATTMNPDAQESYLPIVCLMGIATIAAIFLALLYLSRAWEMMRVVGAHRSGRKAAVLMAIPVVSAFASFTLIYGWSGFWNYQVRTHPGFSTTSKVVRPIFLLFCFAFLTAQSLALYLFTAHLMPGKLPEIPLEIQISILGVALLTGLCVWAAFCRRINFLATKKS